MAQAESTTGLAPWEIEEETEDERQARYAREADEMKLKWDARQGTSRLEEKQSAQRRQAWNQKEQERASLYGPRDPVMEAYEARMYEEARVIEVRRRQREVYERIKAGATEAFARGAGEAGGLRHLRALQARRGASDKCCGGFTPWERWEENGAAATSNLPTEAEARAMPGATVVRSFKVFKLPMNEP
eukprot:Skav201479  [mRNA]  locus=scaffold828:79482:88764:- [translate_table: standard]